eukprot:SAG31_NODE_29907_length_388_cov_0.885813_1_plen_65_part_01
MSQAVMNSTIYGFGLHGRITTIPPGFSCATIVTLVNGGPNHAMHSWGRKLLQYYGKNRAAALSDF